MDSLNYYSPFTTAGIKSEGTTWSRSPGLQSQGEKSMSPNLAAVLFLLPQAGTL